MGNSRLQASPDLTPTLEFCLSAAGERLCEGGGARCLRPSDLQLSLLLAHGDHSGCTSSLGSPEDARPPCQCQYESLCCEEGLLRLDLGAQGDGRHSVRTDSSAALSHICPSRDFCSSARMCVFFLFFFTYTTRIQQIDKECVGICDVDKNETLSRATACLPSSHLHRCRPSFVSLVLGSPPRRGAIPSRRPEPS